MGIPTDHELDEQYEEAIEYSNDKRIHEQSVNREINRAELMLDRRLVYELNALRISIDKSNKISRWLTGAIVFLSFALLVVSVLQYLNL